MAAPIGNANAVKGKMFYDKLRKRLTQEPHRLERIVNELITQAEAGRSLGREGSDRQARWQGNPDHRDAKQRWVTDPVWHPGYVRKTE
jgi:hypothetical protein